MATVNFLYRSAKAKANLNLRLLHRVNDPKYKKGYKDFVFGGSSKIEISKQDWKDIRNQRKINSDPDISNLKVDINKEKNNLRRFILSQFDKTDFSKINSKWLKDIIDLYYNPPEKENPTPTSLIKLIDYYLNNNKYELSDSRKQRIRVIKNKFIRFENYLGYTIQVIDINENLKNKFIEFSDTNNYAPNTQKADISIIKTICTYANKKGVEVSRELADLSIKGEDVESVYLRPDEIETISKVRLKHDYLDNARDWLLISCFTGQRISDFMRFNSDMIVIEDNKHFLEFTQQKTKKRMRIPFVKEAREIISKRNGEFPRAISHQRYNEYIKEVCKLTGMDKPAKGGLMVCVADDPSKATRNDYRKEYGLYPKWQLITSHIGRRSFATNNYGKVPTTYLRFITGHSSEKQFLDYIQKSNKDMASDAYDYFD